MISLRIALASLRSLASTTPEAWLASAREAARGTEANDVEIDRALGRYARLRLLVDPDPPEGRLRDVLAVVALALDPEAAEAVHLPATLGTSALEQRARRAHLNGAVCCLACRRDQAIREAPLAAAGGNDPVELELTLRGAPISVELSPDDRGIRLTARAIEASGSAGVRLVFTDGSEARAEFDTARPPALGVVIPTARPLSDLAHVVVEPIPRHA